MKKRDLVLPFLTTLVIASLLVFISCASTDRVEDDPDSDMATADEGVNDAGAAADSSDSKADDEKQAADSSADSAADSASKDDKKTGQDDLADLTAESGTKNETAKTDAAEKAPEALAQDNKGSEPGLEGAGDLENSIADKDASKALSQVAPTDDKNAVPAEPPPAPTEMAKADALPTDAANADPLKDIKTLPPSIGDENTTPPSNKSRSKGSANRSEASVPHIPAKAVSRDGTLLNRFYFARSGDDPQSVSQLVYGNSNRAADLAAWNTKGKHWKAGTLIYYNSPNRPDDTKMRAFFEERNIPGEDYVVKRRDWLSKIAQVRLGDPRSWKEIAAVNGIEHPDRIEVGQKLLIYPSDLHGFKGAEPSETTVAQNEPPQAAATQSKNPEPPSAPKAQLPPAPNVAPAPPALPASPVAPPIPPQAEAQNHNVEKSDSIDFRKLLEQNALFGFFAALGLLLLIILVSLSKRRRRDDFADDQFAPTTKVKRG